MQREGASGIGKGDPCFWCEIGVFYPARPVRRLHDRGRGQHRPLRIPATDDPLGEEVGVSRACRVVGADEGRPVLHCLFRVIHTGKRRERKAYQARSLPRGVLRGANDQGNHVRCSSHMRLNQHRLIRLGQPESVGAAYVGCREHAHNASGRERRRRVNDIEARAGHRGADRRYIQALVG